MTSTGRETDIYAYLVVNAVDELSSRDASLSIEDHDVEPLALSFAHLTQKSSVSQYGEYR